MTSRLILLHTNDVHGRLEGLARVANLVKVCRAENPDTPVLYLDCGDVEEPSCSLSNVTKGAAMHRLLSRADCDAIVAGNGAWLRYGPGVLASHAESATYPILLANLRSRQGQLLPGTSASTIVRAGTLRIGLVGVTTEMPSMTGSFEVTSIPVIPLVRELSASLRQDGADAVIVLSHMGIDADRELAAQLQHDVIAVIGGHSHSLLPNGEWIGCVLVAHAGQYAEHLGRLDCDWDGHSLNVRRASVLPISGNIPEFPPVLAEAEAIEDEVEAFLSEPIGELAEELDFALDRECGVADWMADILRERMRAEVGLVAAGQAFTGPLPGGILRRRELWDVCSSTANPGMATLSGSQLQEMIQKGLDPVMARSTPRTLRGQELGMLHLSGATREDGEVLIGGRPLDPLATYQVAATDWELEPYGSYVDPSWHLEIAYDMPTILREAAEDHLREHRPVRVTLGRL